MLCWLQLMQAKKWAVITPSSPQVLPELVTTFLSKFTLLHIWQSSFTGNCALSQLPSYRPGWEIPWLEMLQLPKVIWPGAGQGKLWSWQADEAAILEQAGGSGKIWGQQGAHLHPVSGRPERKGLSPRSFPAASSNRTSLRPLQGTLLCCFQHNSQKYTAKKLYTQRQKLLHRGNFGHQEACISFY